MPTSSDRSTLIFLGCVGAPALLLFVGGIGVAVFFFQRRPAPPPSADPGDTPVMPAPAPGDPLGTPGSPGRPRPEHPIVTADMRHVDPQEIFPQVKKVALLSDPHATLESITQNGGVEGGTVDLTGGQSVIYTFGWSYLDSSKPPGKDKVANSVWVTAEHGALKVTSLGGGGTRPPLAEPACPVKRAWQTAVETGVPANAVASVHYYDNSPFSPKSPVVWSFRVDGHDEYRREIDGITCKLVKSWGPKR